MYFGFGTPGKPKSSKPLKKMEEAAVKKVVKKDMKKALKPLVHKPKPTASLVQRNFANFPPSKIAVENKGTKIVQELALNLLRAAPGVQRRPLRLPDLAQNVPTAVCALNTDYDVSLNQGALTPLTPASQNVMFLLKNPYLSSIIFEPNNAGDHAVYVGQGISGSGIATGLSNVWTTSQYLSGQWVNVMPQIWVPSAGTNITPHGNMQFSCGEMNAVWLDNQTTVTATFTTTPSSSLFNFRWSMVKPGPNGTTRTIQIGESISQTPGQPTDMLITNEGYYFFEVQTNQDSQSITIDGMQKDSASYIWGQRCAEGLDNVISSMTDVRTTFAACELSNMTPEMYKGGLVVGLQVRTGTDIALYQSADVFDKISKAALSSKAQSFADGMYIPYKDAGLVDIDWHNSMIVDAVYGLQTVQAMFPWQDNYVVMATNVTATVGTPTQQPIFRVWTDLEFQTESQFFILGQSKYTPEQFEAARRLASRTHNFYPNSSHWGDIWNQVTNWVKGAANKTAEFLPRVAKFAVDAAPIANAVAKLF